MKLQKQKHAKRPRIRLGVEEKPPMFQSSVSIGKTFRFQATAAGVTQLTNKSFGDLLCVATTATSASQLAQVIRIRKIEIWGPMASNLTPVTVSCEFQGTTTGQVGRSEVRSDTSIGSTRVAYISAKPGRDSSARLWLDASSANVVCILAYPAGAIIDVHYSMVLRDAATVSAVTGAVSGATIGALYLRSLDSVTATNLPPLSYATI